MLSSGGALAMLTNVGLLQLVAVHLRNQGPWVLLYAFVFGTAAVLLLLLRPFLSTASRRFQVFFFSGVFGAERVFAATTARRLHWLRPKARSRSSVVLSVYG